MNEPYTLTFEVESIPIALKPLLISYSITQGDTIITDLARVHEQLSHLIIVSEDLSYFDHVHADFDRSNGNFSVKHIFPGEGTYILFADFTPQKTGVTQVERYELIIGKNASVDQQEESDSRPAATEEVSIKQHTSPDILTVNQDAQLVYKVQDQKGKLVKDIEPFLGAPGHLVIISKDTKTFLHAHPEMDSHSMEHGSNHSHHQAEKADSFGPELNFHTQFPSAGSYKVWLEIKRGGNQHRKSFQVDVKS